MGTVDQFVENHFSQGRSTTQPPHHRSIDQFVDNHLIMGTIDQFVDNHLTMGTIDQFATDQLTNHFFQGSHGSGVASMLVYRYDGHIYETCEVGI